MVKVTGVKRVGFLGPYSQNWVLSVYTSEPCDESVNTFSGVLQLACLARHLPRNSCESEHPKQDHRGLVWLVGKEGTTSGRATSNTKVNSNSTRCKQ